MGSPMAISGLVEYSRTELERRAREYLSSRHDIPHMLPIKVELMLDTTPNIVFDTFPGLVVKHGVEGAICTQNGSKDLFVFIDEGIACGHDSARYNAAVGEELAHVRLHGAVLMQVKTIEHFLEIQRHPDWDKSEYDARIFSAAIRMPCHLVEKHARIHYCEIVDSLGFGQTRQIEMAINARLARLFEVPLEDMRRRLMNWPCEVMRRVQMSVLSCSPELTPSDPVKKFMPVFSPQKTLFEEL